MDVRSEVKSNYEELIDLRRWFHMHPELGFKEYKTSEKITQYLRDLGFRVKTGVAKTGVVGIMDGDGGGPTLLMRSDMDALPLKEENDLPYRSVNEGLMHACGHDAHIAMLLVAAKILKNHRDQINGKIKFVFQPNEEEAGAEDMVKDGVMEDPDVDAAIGAHIWTPIPTGTVAVVSGPVMASSYYFKLKIIGKGGHGGSPHTVIDPILCASHVIQAVQSIQTRDMSALDPTVITFGRIHGGSFNIIIPESVEIEGSIRCLHMKDKLVRDRFEEVVSSICAAHKAEYELDFLCGNRLLSNHEAMTELVQEVAGDVVGDEKIIGEEIRMMIGEDFAEFSLRVPSCFYFIGTGNLEKGTDFPHHSRHFKIDENSLPIGVEMHVKTALEYFKRNG